MAKKLIHFGSSVGRRRSRQEPIVKLTAPARDHTWFANNPSGNPPLAVIYAISVVSLTANTVLSPSLPEILVDLDLSKRWAGIIVGAGPAPGILFAPILGVLADRYGKRLIVSLSLCLFGLATVPIALAPNVWLLIAGRALQGVGASTLVAIAIAIIADFWDGDDRTRYIGWNSAVITSCVALLPLAGGITADLSSWRWAAALQLIAIPAALLVWLKLPDASFVEANPTTTSAGTDDYDGPNDRAEVTVGNRLKKLGGSARQTHVRPVLVLGFVSFFLIFGVFLTIMPLFLKSEFGLETTERSLVIALPGAFAVLGALSVSAIRRRLDSHWKVLAIGLGLFCAAFVGLSVAPVIALVIAAAALYGFAEGFTIPTMQETSVRAAPPSERATYVALFTSASRTGQAVGPLAAAAIASTVGDRISLGAAALVAGSTVVYILRVRDRSDKILHRPR